MVCDGGDHGLPRVGQHGVSLRPKGDPRDPFAVAWSLSRDDGGSWHQMPPSENEMFVTLAEPDCAVLYRTVAYLACGHGNATDPSDVLTNTWWMFSTGSGPRNVNGWDEASRGYSRPLHYYLESNDYTTVAKLLEHGDGQCGAWALLFRDSLRTNGVSGPGIKMVRPTECDWFGVREIDFGNPTYPDAPIWRYVHDPLQDQGDLDIHVSDIPGQNTNPPASKLFTRHYVYLYAGGDGLYYDPSYGVTYTGPADFVTKAVDAWGDGYPPSEVRWCKVGDLPNASVEFE